MADLTPASGQTSGQTSVPRPAGTFPGDLGWNLGMVLRGYQARFEQAVEGMPRGIRGFQVLSTVVHRDPPNQQALGAHLGIDRTVCTYLIDALADAGAVRRVQAPTDRRARKVVATAEGRSLLATFEERVAAAEADFLAVLDDSEAESLTTLVGSLAMDIHRSQPGFSPCEAMDRLP